MEPFLTTSEIIALAKQQLTPDLWGYVSGGAESETTLMRNRLALDSLAFMPSVLEDVRSIDTSTTLLGRTIRIPVVIAPIGSVQVLHPDGVLATARAAAAFGTIVFGSYPLATPTFEEVLAAVDAPLVVNLYLFGDADWVGEMIERARRAGACALAVTVDSPVYGRRERDITNRYSPRAMNPNGRLLPVEESDANRASTTWETIRDIRRRWTGPLILKGIVNPLMAKRAVEVGVDVVYVSNHGGRQLDCLPATTDVLPEIVDAVGGRAEVIVDGGFVRGTDVVKALALGANAVAIGKLQAWALAAGGAAALVRTLELLETEMRIAMGLCGVTRVAQITRDLVRPGVPVREPSATSAFPHLTL